jgi:hypothetical protein
VSVGVPPAGRGLDDGGFSPLDGLDALASAADGGASSCAAVGDGCSADTAAAAVGTGVVLAAGAAFGGAAECAGTTALRCSSMCTGGVCTVLCAVGVGGAAAGRGFERPISKPPIPTVRMRAATAARFPRLLEAAGGAVSEANSVV